jgi:hypothetical protein
MNKIKSGTGFAVFVIFFGLAVLEAFANGDILWIVLWILIGSLFVVSDNLEKHP